jgi:hypothetical protein
MRVSGYCHTPTVLYSWGKDLQYPLVIEGWVGLRAALDTEARGKILCFCQGLNRDRPVVQSVVRHYTDGAIPVPNKGEVTEKIKLLYYE